MICTAKITLHQKTETLPTFLAVTHSVMDDNMEMVHYDNYHMCADKASVHEVLEKWQGFLQEGGKIQCHGTVPHGSKYIVAQKQWIR